MKNLYSSLIKVSNGIFSVQKWLLLVAVVCAVSVNFLNVCLRYLANSGLAFCETLSVVLFMFMVVIGANIAVKSDSEIKIDIFQFGDPRKTAAFQLVSDVITLAALIVAMIGLYDTICSVMLNLQKVTPLPIYTYQIYSVMLIGFALVTFDRVIVFLRHILTVRGETVEEEAAA